MILKENEIKKTTIKNLQSIIQILKINGNNLINFEEFYGSFWIEIENEKQEKFTFFYNKKDNIQKDLFLTESMKGLTIEIKNFIIAMLNLIETDS